MSSPYNLRGNDVYDYGSEHTLDSRKYRRRRDLFAASNQAKADIRPNAPVPKEFKSGIFAYMFGQPKFEYSKTRNVDKKVEHSDVFHEDPVAAESNIDQFEASALKLETESDKLTEIIQKINDPFLDHTQDLSIPEEFRKSDAELIRDDLNYSDDNVTEPERETNEALIERHETEEELDTIPETPLPTSDEVEIENEIDEQLENPDWANNYHVSARKAQERKDLINGFISEIKSSTYLKEKKNFLKEIGIKPPDPQISYSDYSNSEQDYLKKILLSRDTKFEKPESFVRYPVIYIPSGGGKSRMKDSSRHPRLYFDQDELVFHRYDEFQLANRFMEAHNLDLGFIEAWFRYEFHINYDNLIRDKVLLVSNPRMLPHYHRNHFNELVIIPAQYQWNLRFFNKDFFSLLALNSKPKFLSDYEYYEDVILNCFDSYLSAVDVHMDKAILDSG